ncbi:MAG TPA: HlyD family secretion protein [Candidatus Saccharimonadia bacterium]|nr:HlyD family secretion protein [Candidatus Saccharimonadia bacterium]
MIELIIGVYGGICWLLFKKFKVIPTNSYTVCTAILGGLGILLMIAILLSVFHPSTKDGRLYATTVPIVSQVKGKVVEVPAVANTPLKKGDVLFRLDPKPFEIEVQRLEATLAGENSRVAQLEEKLAAAVALVEQAKENLRVSESVNDRQLRETVESATGKVSEMQAQLDYAKTQDVRRGELLAKGAVSQEEADFGKKQVSTADASLKQAQASLREAEEKINAGGSKTMASRQDLKRAEAQAQEIRLEIASESGGFNPKVRETMAALDAKRWELEQTVVRAPSDGFVTQVMLRPGQMAVPFPVAPVMIFVPAEKPTFIATYAQTVIPGVKPGLEAELAFKAYPGRIFKAKVVRVMPIISEGQVQASGQLLDATSAYAPGRVPVILEYDDELAALNLPIGAQATTAIYMEQAHALSIVRKILLRIKSWEHYLFFVTG